MKHARFLHEGRIVTGIVQGDVMVDEAGHERHVSEIQVWLPPVVPHNMIGIIQS